MDATEKSQLDKVLALADSSYEGEAVVAVRKARQLLSRDGLNFSDLARAAILQRPRLNFPFSLFSAQQVNLEAKIEQLQQRIFDLELDLNKQSVETELWKKRTLEVEQNLALSNSQSQRWRELARETVEKLWDLGQSLRSDEFTTSENALKTPSKEKSA